MNPLTIPAPASAHGHGLPGKPAPGRFPGEGGAA